LSVKTINGLKQMMSVMNKKAQEDMVRQLVKMVIFALMLFLIIRFGAKFYNLVYGDALDPSVKTLNFIDKAVDTFNPDFDEITRKIPVQTDEFMILGFKQGSEICERGGEDYPCICACTHDTCLAEKRRFKTYCKYVPYEPSSDFKIDAGIDKIVTHEIYLEQVDEKYVLGIKMSP